MLKTPYEAASAPSAKRTFLYLYLLQIAPDMAEREAIVMYQWYSACVQEPSLDDFEVWLARQVEKHPNFKKEVESWRQYFQRHPEEQEAA